MLPYLTLASGRASVLAGLPIPWMLVKDYKRRLRTLKRYALLVAHNLVEDEGMIQHAGAKRVLLSDKTK